MNELLSKIASTSKQGPSADELKILSRQAVGLFTSKKEESLTDAVQSVVQDGNLNRDQVQRVAEMANQDAWRVLFTEGGGGDTQFEPADATRVLEEVADESRTVSSRALDYVSDPGERTPDMDLESIFNVSSDSEEYESLNPHKEQQERHEKAASAEDLARRGVDKLYSEMHDAAEEFYGLFKQAHIRDGYGVLQVAKAVGEVVSSEKFATSITKTAASRLAGEGVKVDMAAEMQKATQPVVINTEHPLLESVTKLEKLSHVYNQVHSEYKSRAAETAKAEQELKESMRSSL